MELKKYFCRSLDYLLSLLEPYCLDVFLFWLVALIIIIVAVVFWRKSRRTGVNCRIDSSWLKGLALILIPIVGGFWAVFQFRIATDAQLKIEMNQPEIRKNLKTGSYELNVNVGIVNSGRNVEFIFTDKNPERFNEKYGDNIPLNKCIGKHTEENTVSCFMAKKVEYNEAEFSERTTPFLPIATTIDWPTSLIRKGVTYDYSSLFMVKEPGWYSLEFYLVVDYNKDTVPLFYRKHPNRYVTWIEKKYVYVGDDNNSKNGVNTDDL